MSSPSATSAGGAPPRARRLRRTAAAALVGAATALSAALPVSLVAAPAASADAPSREDVYVKRVMHRMTLPQKVGQMMTGYVYGSDARTSDPRNTALYGVATPAEVVEEYALGGVVHFAWTDSFREGPEQLARLNDGLQEAARGANRRVPLMISTDQETGLVARLGPPATGFPGAMALGAGRSPEDARRAAAVTGTELRAVGITQDYAPVADVNVDPANPVIGVRSFGSDPQLVADMVAAQVVGYQEDGGVATSAKHFPGHGDTATDSHVGLPVIDHTREEWERLDAPPFRAAVEAGVDAVMTAHIVVPSLDPSGVPATLSEPIMTGVLREEMGFEGVITTDSLEMEGVRTMFGDGEVAVRAVEAGADVLLMPAQPRVAVDALLGAVASGRLTEERLDESVERVLRLKWHRGVVADSSTDVDAVLSTLGSAEHQAVAQEVTDRTTTLLRDDAGLLPLAGGEQRDVLVTGWGAAPAAALGAALSEHGDVVEVQEVGASAPDPTDPPDPGDPGGGPADPALDTAVAAAEEADLVVVLTNGAWSSPRGDRQRRAVAELVATGTPVVHVAVRDPYDVAHLPGVTTSLATYSTTPVAMRSLARVLHGDVAPAGRLPVDVPAADGSGVLLPLGWGLTYGADGATSLGGAR
ncbi:glycoside hydrolase family 3 protein [uncultured Pseudokineococcus sp.]|uniref:glycoside hydrolase family 3 protein n=1 Tax=uncultured Pseudokineococcus sp. TaxID=1642928 RepID=UPI002618F111|nr:glycoside hydrolase family 3 protein [uncultured Pseudokineococcus sp.]